MRDKIQELIYCIIKRPVSWMVRCGVRPNHITTISLVGNIIASVMIATATSETGIGLAGVIILLFSSLDMVDGYMARTHNLASKFGAFFDSVVDRYCELFALSALTLYIINIYSVWIGGIGLMAITGSLMVSYVRARAESVGTTSKVGLMQRPERVVLICAGCILTWTTANPACMLVALSIIAFASNITAIRRIMCVFRHFHRQSNDHIAKNA